MSFVVIPVAVTSLEDNARYPANTMQLIKQLQSYMTKPFFKPKKQDGAFLHSLKKHAYNLIKKRKRPDTMPPIATFNVGNYHIIKRLVCNKNENKNCSHLFKFFNRF